MRKFALFTGLILILFCAGSAMAQSYADLAVGYSNINARPGNIGGSSSSSSGGSFNFQGAGGSVAGYLNHWFGIVADLGANRIDEQGVTGNVFTYLFGPRVSINHGGKLSPFVHGLFGGARLRATVSGTSNSINAFATALGGGLDINASPHIGIRIVQAEYLMTRFNSTTQNNIRVGAGLIIRFGKRP